MYWAKKTENLNSLLIHETKTAAQFTPWWLHSNGEHTTDTRRRAVGHFRVAWALKPGGLSECAAPHFSAPDPSNQLERSAPPT